MKPLFLKAWFECRSRFLLAWLLTAVLLFDLALLAYAKNTEGEFGPERLMEIVYLAVMAPLAALILAGSGINTQTSWGLVPGLHPSTGFLLSLPVRRVDLLWTRAAAGAALLLAWVLVTHPALVAAAGAAGVSGWIPGMSALPYVALVTLLYYTLCVWLSVVLDELWATIVAISLFGAAAGYSLAGGPGWLNLIDYMKADSGERQLAQSVFCVALAAGFLGLAGFSVRRKEL
jgi:hypothetical protein